MANKKRKHTYTKDELVDAIVKMRLENSASIRTIFKFLQEDLGYAQAQAYVYWNCAQELVTKYWEESNRNAAKENIGQLEEQMELAKANGDHSHWLNLRKEYNKCVGLHAAEKIEHSGDLSLSLPDKIVTEIIHKSNGQE